MSESFKTAGLKFLTKSLTEISIRVKKCLTQDSLNFFLASPFWYTENVKKWNWFWQISFFNPYFSGTDNLITLIKFNIDSFIAGERFCIDKLFGLILAFDFSYVENAKSRNRFWESFKFLNESFPQLLIKVLLKT